MAMVTDTIFKINQNTRELLPATITATWRDGTPMTDEKCGGIYNKDLDPNSPTFGQYFKWEVAGMWPISRSTDVNQSNLQKTINDYGDNSATLFIDKTVDITSNITIPEHISIVAACKIPFNILSGVRLTILSAINEGSRQIFSGEGNVLLNAPLVNIMWFGAKRDANGQPGIGTDCSVAINKAIDSIRVSGARVFVPEGNFRVVKSINMTKPNPANAPLIIQGANKARSIITLDLDEAYPGIDCSNNKRGSLNRILVRSTSASLDTCSVLLAENEASGVNLFVFDDAVFDNASPNAKLALAGICADQIKFLNTEVGARGAQSVVSFYLSSENKYNITSKFITIGKFTGDLTYVSGLLSQFTCAGNSGVDNSVIELEEFSLVAFSDCYFAPTGTNFNGPTISLKSGTRNMQPMFKNCRTEGGTSEGSADVFRIVDVVYNGSFSGSFITRTQGGVFTGPGRMELCTFDGSIQPRLFRDMGRLISCEFNVTSGPNVLGTLLPDAISDSYNLTLAGRVGTLESIVQTLGAQRGLKLKNIGNNNNTSFLSASEGVLYPSPKSPLNYRVGVVGDSGTVAIGTYTGGSGTQQVASFPIPVAPFDFPAIAQSQKAYPFLDFEIWGDTTTGFAADGRIAVTLTQGTNTVTLAELLAIPAGQRGFKISCRLFIVSTSGTSIIAMTDIDSAPTASGSRHSTSRYTNVGSAGIVKSGENINVGISVRNTSDNPIAHLLRTIKG